MGIKRECAYELGTSRDKQTRLLAAFAGDYFDFASHRLLGMNSIEQEQQHQAEGALLGRAIFLRVAMETRRGTNNNRCQEKPNNKTPAPWEVRQLHACS